MERVRLACLGLQAWGELRGLLEVCLVGIGLGARLGGHLVLLDMRWLLAGMVRLEEALRLHLVQLLASRRDPSEILGCLLVRWDVTGRSLTEYIA